MELNRISLRGASLGRVPLPRISLQGKEKGGGALSFEGYPLEVDVPNARSMRNYTLFGNTSEDAKGVGDEVVNLVKNRNFSYTWGDGFNIQISTDGRVILNGTATSGKSVSLGLESEGGYIAYSIGDKLCFVINNPAIRIRIGNDFYSGMGNKVVVSTVAGNNAPAIEINAGTYDNVVLYPMIFRLNDTLWEDCTTADDFAHRLGYADAEHLPAFLYGSSFVAPIRVSSAGGDTLYPSVLSSPLHKIGDIVDYKESNGKEVHNYIELDLGDFNYTRTASGLFSTSITGRGVKYPPNSSTPAIVRLKGYATIASSPISGTHPNKEVALNEAGTLYINTTGEYTDVTAFKAGMAGTKLVALLATPTEVQGEPLPRLAIPKGESIVTLDTAVEPSNITAKV